MPATVDVGPGEEQVVLVDDVYEPRTGLLMVIKQARGEAAAFRREVQIDVVCDDGTEQSMVRPIGAPLLPLVMPGQVAGTSCTVSEVSDGSSALVEVVTEPAQPQQITLEGDVVRVVRVTNTYTATRGSLTVTKQVTGLGAALRGAVRVVVDCLSRAGSFTLPVDASSPTSITLGGLFRVSAAW